jgi:hypothetical protein
MTVDLVIRNGRVVPPGGVIRRNTGGRCEVGQRLERDAADRGMEPFSLDARENLDQSHPRGFDSTRQARAGSARRPRSPLQEAQFKLVVRSPVRCVELDGNGQSIEGLEEDRPDDPPFELALATAQRGLPPGM